MVYRRPYPLPPDHVNLGHSRCLTSCREVVLVVDLFPYQLKKRFNPQYESYVLYSEVFYVRSIFPDVLSGAARSNGVSDQDPNRHAGFRELRALRGDARPVRGKDSAGGDPSACVERQGFLIPVLVAG